MKHISIKILKYGMYPEELLQISKLVFRHNSPLIIQSRIELKFGGSVLAPKRVRGARLEHARANKSDFA